MSVNLKPIAGNFYISEENFEPDSHDVHDGLLTAGTHRLLRFDFSSYNSGDTDLVLGSPTDPSNEGRFELSHLHDHYHLLDFNEYMLFDAAGTAVREGYKQSYCLVDWVRMDDWANETPQFTDCNVSQGISAGWADLYRSTVPGQYVVIDGLPDGEYTLRATTNYVSIVNPENGIAEDTYADNTIWIGLSISGNEVAVIEPPVTPELGIGEFGRTDVHEEEHGEMHEDASDYLETIADNVYEEEHGEMHEDVSDYLETIVDDVYEEDSGMYEDVSDYLETIADNVYEETWWIF